ncbi:MAG: HAMP domain-containing protein, partial [Janthinobacterium lividum]
MADNSRLKLLISRVLFGTVAVLALLLLVLLALASSNTEFFDRYYSWLYAANLAVALLFMLIVAALVWIIIARFRQGRFGTRLLAKLAVYFALVGVLPGGIIYLVSLQFLSRSIESWFDVNVEKALDSGLTLGRGMLDNALTDLRGKAHAMSEQLAASGDANTTLNLLRLRDQFGVQEAMVIAPSMRGSTVLAQASSNFALLMPDDLPTPLMLSQARGAGYAAVEGELDGEGTAGAANGALRLRVVVRIPGGLDTSLQGHDRFLQVTQPVPPALARNAEAVQLAYRQYQEKALGRTGLRKMYIGTLTLALFLATFIGIMLALALGNQLARPLFVLAQGTREVARGDYTPKREFKSNDELGFLTQLFNAMTRQLSEAHRAVEQNRSALEQSKTYLESILANLTAGVFVFDQQFRLTTANRGAERIFRQDFQGQLHVSLEQVPALVQFGEMVRKAFADRDAATSADRSEHDHWQQQIEVTVAGETDPLTLLVRGTRLLPKPASVPSQVPGGGAAAVDGGVAGLADAVRELGPEESGSASALAADLSRVEAGSAELDAAAHRGDGSDATPGSEATGASVVPLISGYVVVFDDISDVISAQRSVAWGEVARRLAHEIKNPLTPIQLSAERLQMKLTDKLGPVEAEFLKRGATTIINQVAAMKRMVDDFREYARTPPAVMSNLQLNDLIGEVLTLYGADDRKSAIEARLAPLPIIKGDGTQ